MTALMGLAPQRRTRRSAAAVEAIEMAIFETLQADHPQTLRGLFYQLVSAGVIPKTEAAYKGTVGMFERAGFDVVERRRATRTSTPRPIVRRSI